MAKERVCQASDGIRARINGEWGEVKLQFLDAFVPPALSITQSKQQRVFVDLFAGPGRNVTEDRRREFEGGSIRALRMRGTGRNGPPFTHSHHVNLVRLDQDALRTRVDKLYAAHEGLVPRPHVSFHDGDANLMIPRIMSAIPRQAYVFVFADIEAPKQLPWSSVRALKALGHDSVDLYVLFPLDMGINRLISIANREHTERYEKNLTTFFGTDAWRAICDRRITNAQSPEVRHAMTELYLGQLRTLWPHAGVVRDVVGRGKRMYRMLFATKHDAAKRVADFVRHGGRGDAQPSLF